MTPDLIAGRYQVVRAIGKGGMGTVWLCRDEMLGREVAVKQVGNLPGESATDTARALREARSSAALNHRNVVSVFDVVDTSDGAAWLVMEYIPSRTLSELVRDEGPLDPVRASRIGAQVADGLAAAHAAGTIHRDVKPGNILVADDDTAKISDFGIARMADGDQLTRTGLVTGTPSYFSPELARGEDPGSESDVYALGATLYTAVQGTAPYPDQRNAIALLQQIAAGEPAPPTNAGPLAGPIARMMDRDPASRWTMADAAQALHRVAEHGTFADDDTAVLTSAAPAAAGAGAGAAAYDPEPTPVTPVDPRDPEDEPRRSKLPLLAGAALLLLLVLGVGYALLGGEDSEREPQARDTPAQSASPEEQQDEPDASPTNEQTAEQEEQPAEEPPAEEAGFDGGAAEQAVTDYFGVMPGDTDSGWQRLSPRMQEETGRESYEGFWGSIEEVDVQSVQAVQGQDAVDVVLTYYFEDGSATEERQRLTMVRPDDAYLIDDDEVLSSRTVS